MHKCPNCGYSSQAMSGKRKGNPKPLTDKRELGERKADFSFRFFRGEKEIANKVLKLVSKDAFLIAKLLMEKLSSESQGNFECFVTSENTVSKISSKTI